MQGSTFIEKKHYSLFWLYMLLFALIPTQVDAQHFELTNNRKRTTLPFKMVRNMIIVKVHINNRGPYNFVLDTGVGIMVLTDSKLIDSLGIKPTRTIKIYGLGGQDYEALVTPTLDVEMPGIRSYAVAAAVLKEDHFGLSNYAGMHIHGLLGYDFFSNLGVKVNFYDSTLTVSSPQHIRKLRRGVKLPITIEDRKPYLQMWIKMPDGRETKRKLVIDIGAGHPLSLENMLKENGLPQNFISGNLGMGLTGPITGFISRVNAVELGKYSLKDVITSFPDDESLKKTVTITPRDGNLGLGVLKKFTILFNYPGNAIYLRKGQYFNEPIEHDMSGMDYFFMGEDFGHLIVGRVEPGSAADEVGIETDDEITAINFKPISKMSIEQIDRIFRSKNGRNLLLEVYRNKQSTKVLLTLKRRI